MLLTRSPTEQSRRSLIASSAVLVAANLAPLYGATFLGWSVFEIVIVYWAENLVIGLLNLPRILLATGGKEGKAWAGNLVTALFFIVHYGGFCLGHLVFLAMALGGEESSSSNESGNWFLFAVLSLFASHLYSFFRHYLGRREYRQTSATLQMFAPYGRIMVLHVAIVLAAVGVEKMGQPILLLAILVIGKTAVDLAFHYFSHLRRAYWSASMEQEEGS